MRLVATGSANDQDLSAGYITVRTVAAPSSGAAQYILAIKLTSLATTHNLTVRETQGAVNYDSVFGGNGTTANQVVVEVFLNTGAASVDVKLTDTVAGTTVADWTWDLFEVTLPNIDGETFDTWATNVRAATRGLVSVVDNGNGTYTLTFKKADGTTTAFSITYNPTTGART